MTTARFVLVLVKVLGMWSHKANDRDSRRNCGREHRYRSGGPKDAKLDFHVVVSPLHLSSSTTAWPMATKCELKFGSTPVILCERLFIESESCFVMDLTLTSWLERKDPYMNPLHVLYIGLRVVDP